jgi:pilus assembly protein Flp/PilA
MWSRRWVADETRFLSAACLELQQMKNLIARFLKDEAGATAIEYGLIAAGIALAIIAAVQGVGKSLSTNFNTISTSLK